MDQTWGHRHPHDRELYHTLEDSRGLSLSETRRHYDPAGNLLLRQDDVYLNNRFRRTIQTEWTYDSRNHPTSLLEAGERLTTYAYTPGGRLASKRTPDHTFTYAYTPLGDLQTLIADRSLTHHFSYDRLGRLLTATDGSITIQRTLDPYGNTLREDQNGLIISQEYDAFDRLTRLILPDNSEISYTYDPLHLLQVERQGQTHTCTYDQRGELSTETLFDGQPRHYIYDLAGNCNCVTSPAFFQRVHRRDSHHNPLDIEDSDGHCSLSYDSLDQLGHTFDSLHNPAHTPTDELNQFTFATYDPSGNPTQLNDHAYTYDPFARLTRAQTPTGTTTYTYDPLGRRLTKNETRYLYHNQLEIGSLDPQGNFQDLLIPNPSTGQPLAIELDSALHTAHCDLTGNVRRLTSPLQTLAASYTPFGLTSATLPFGFAGKRYDLETGLSYFGKRYYVPSLSRWLTPDPALFRDSLNLYQYCFNNPYRYQDPNGEFIIVVPLVVWGSATLGSVLFTTAAATATAAIVYGGYKLQESLNHRAPPYQPGYTFIGGTLLNTQPPLLYNQKKRNPNAPPAKNAEEAIEAGWIDVSHPAGTAAGHHEVKDPETGDTWRFDQAKEGRSGHSGRDHWHHQNPNSQQGRRDAMLDIDGNPCGEHSGPSHLYYR